MAGWVEVKVLNQLHGCLVKIPVEKRQSPEAHQENQQSLGSLEEGDDPQSPCLAVHITALMFP